MIIFGDKELESIDSMLKSVFENLSRPIIPSALFFVDNVNEDSELAFVSVIF